MSMLRNFVYVTVIPGALMACSSSSETAGDSVPIDVGSGPDAPEFGCAALAPLGPGAAFTRAPTKIDAVTGQLTNPQCVLAAAFLREETKAFFLAGTSYEVDLTGTGEGEGPEVRHSVSTMEHTVKAGAYPLKVMSADAAPATLWEGTLVVRSASDSSVQLLFQLQ